EAGGFETLLQPPLHFIGPCAASRPRPLQQAPETRPVTTRGIERGLQTPFHLEFTFKFTLELVRLARAQRSGSEGRDTPSSASSATSSLLVAMSPNETMPTRFLSRSTTGRRRICVSPIFSMTASTSSSSKHQRTLVHMASSTRA